MVIPTAGCRELQMCPPLEAGASEVNSEVGGGVLRQALLLANPWLRSVCMKLPYSYKFDDRGSAQARYVEADQIAGHYRPVGC